MLALIGEASARQSEDALEVAAHGEQRRRFKGKVDAERNEPARAANELRRAIDERDHRIVAALEDLAVVDEEGVGDVAQARAGFVVVDGDGLFTQIGGGHDKSAEHADRQRADAARRVRQKDAEPRDARRDPGAIPLARTRACEDDGTGRVCKCFFLGVKAQRARAASRSRTMTASGLP